MSETTKEVSFLPSTIETIDTSVYNWLNDQMNISVSSKNGFKKVEVVWVSSERSHLSKKSKESRELTGALVLPLIRVERTSVVKDLAKKGKAIGNCALEKDEKGGSVITIARTINQEKTSNFANADSRRATGQINFPRKNKKVVYQTVTIPMPVYVEVMYEIKLKCLYQQQMNEMVQPFVTFTDGINYFILKHDGHRFEGFMQADFSQGNNGKELQQSERIFETTLNLKVLGYIIGRGVNDESPKLIYRENAVVVAFPRETTIFGDVSVQGASYGGLEVDGKERKKRNV